MEDIFSIIGCLSFSSPSVPLLLSSLAITISSLRNAGLVASRDDHDAVIRNYCFSWVITVKAFASLEMKMKG